MISVNITTTLDRADLCAQAVFSIINQTLTPDKICIWLSKEPYLRDKGFTSPPTWVNELNKIKDIIEVHWTENTGPYRKLLPALRSATDSDLVITADDDIVYGRNWLHALILEHKKNPAKIIAARVRKTQTNILGKRKSYIHWPIIKTRAEVSAGFVVTHGGGAIFQRRLISERLINDDSYLSICPTTDDLWYSMLIKESNSSVLVCPEALSELFFIEHDTGLENENTLITKKLTTKIYQKTVLNLLGWLGLNICNNDISAKKIKAHLDTNSYQVFNEGAKY